MIELRTLTGETLSLAIKDLSPINNEGQVVKNRLIDGTYHVQAIGTPAKSREFKVLANENQVDLIGEAEALGQTLELQVDDTIYKGLIDSPPTWQRLTMRHNSPTDRLYTADIKFNINSGG